MATEMVKDLLGHEKKIHKGKAIASAKVQVMMDEIKNKGIYDPHIRIAKFLGRNSCSICEEKAIATVSVAASEFVYMCKGHLITHFQAVFMVL